MIIDVVVITYNQEKYILQALESILLQKRISFTLRINVYDDKSSDRTTELIEKFINENTNIQINLYKNELNLGATLNLYNALINCDGDYVAILEGDDYWIDSDKLEKQLKALEENRECIMSTHINDTVNYMGEHLYYTEEAKSNSIYGLQNLINMGTVGQTGTLFIRNIFRENKGEFEQLFKYHRLMCDITLSFILLTKGSCFCFANPMSAYRTHLGENYHNASTQFKKNYIESYTSYIYIYQKLEAYYGINVKPLIIMRNVELIDIYLLHKSISTAELIKYLKQFKFHIIIESLYISFKRGVKYVFRKGIGYGANK